MQVCTHGSEDKRKAQLSMHKQLLDPRHAICRPSRTHELSLISPSADGSHEGSCWDTQGWQGNKPGFLSPQDFLSLIPTILLSVLSKKIVSSVSIKASCVFLVLLSSPQSARSQAGWSSKKISLPKGFHSYLLISYTRLCHDKGGRTMPIFITPI